MKKPFMYKICIAAIAALTLFSACKKDEEEPSTYTVSDIISLCSGGVYNDNLNIVFYASQEDANERKNEVLSISGTPGQSINLSALTDGKAYWVWMQGNNGRTNWVDVLAGSNFTYHAN